jgi:hypothetical protein
MNVRGFAAFASQLPWGQINDRLSLLNLQREDE